MKLSGFDKKGQTTAAGMATTSPAGYGCILTTSSPEGGRHDDHS